MGEVVLKHGNAVEMGGFKHIRAGREIARPMSLNSGEQALVTPTGRVFKMRKI